MYCEYFSFDSRRSTSTATTWSSTTCFITSTEPEVNQSMWCRYLFNIPLEKILFTSSSTFKLRRQVCQKCCEIEIQLDVAYSDTRQLNLLGESLALSKTWTFDFLAFFVVGELAFVARLEAIDFLSAVQI